MQGPAGTAHDWETNLGEWNKVVTNIQMVVLIITPPKAHHKLAIHPGHPIPHTARGDLHRNVFGA